MTLWGVAGLLLALALAAGFYPARAGYHRAVLIAAAALAVGLAVLLVVAEQIGGWDGLGLAAMTVIGLGPVVAGLVAGGVAGLIARRRAGD